MFEFLIKLKWFFKENKWWYISILAVLIIVNVLEVIPAQLIGRAIDFISTGEITLMLMWQLIIAFLDRGDDADLHSCGHFVDDSVPEIFQRL